MTIHFSGSDKPFPATSNALVVRHLIIHQASADVVLGFIGRTGRHPPYDDSDSIAGVAGWALSLHGTKLFKVTDISVGRLTYGVGGSSSFGLSVAPSFNSSWIALIVAGIPFS